jgi:hypothetical protein
MTTDPARREAFIAGLRELADFLTANPAVPVETYEREITMQPSHRSDDDDAHEIEEFASVTGATLLDDRATSGKYEAIRTFGVVSYRAFSYTRASMAKSAAQYSYANNVQVDIPAAGVAEIARAA